MRFPCVRKKTRSPIFRSPRSTCWPSLYWLAELDAQLLAERVREHVTHETAAVESGRDLAAAATVRDVAQLHCEIGERAARMQRIGDGFRTFRPERLAQRGCGTASSRSVLNVKVSGADSVVSRAGNSGGRRGRADSEALVQARSRIAEA